MECLGLAPFIHLNDVRRQRSATSVLSVLIQVSLPMLEGEPPLIKRRAAADPDVNRRCGGVRAVIEDEGVLGRKGRL